MSSPSPSPSSKPVLLDFCHEILHEILINLPPADIASVSGSCKSLHSYVTGNRLLWRDLYLNQFDDPPRKAHEDEPKWEDELKKLVIFQKILASNDLDVKRSAIADTCNTAVRLLQLASPNVETSANIPFLEECFEDRNNANIFLFSSNLYSRAGSEDQRAAATEIDRQAAAKLHSYYGTSKEAIGRTRAQTRAQDAHPFARSSVYDLRNYTDENFWGPFMDDGSLRTDWEKVENLMIVLGYNIEGYVERSANPAMQALMIWHQAFEGVTPNSYTPKPENDQALAMDDRVHKALIKEIDAVYGSSYVRQPEPPLDAMDPYGVSGAWRRVVCFLDYNDLYHFNFADQIPDNEPRPPITTTEAIRLIIMQLRVDRIEEPSATDGQGLPVVHFSGTSRSMHSSWDPNANSRLVGSVRLTPEGEVRWQTLSLFDGEERWRSESIQVGGLRSARGVIGTWFDKDHDLNGPAGPTAFWKIDDEVGKEWGSACELITYN